MLSFNNNEVNITTLIILPKCLRLEMLLMWFATKIKGPKKIKKKKKRLSPPPPQKKYPFARVLCEKYHQRNGKIFKLMGTKKDNPYSYLVFVNP